PTDRYGSANTCMAAEWYRGMATSGSSSAVKSSPSTQLTYSWTSAEWDIIAPLGAEVVPEVYSSWARSSPRAGESIFSTGVSSTAASRIVPSAAPPAAGSRASDGSPASWDCTSASVSACAGSTRTSEAPESVSMYSNSPPVSAKFTGTWTNPAREV